MKCEAKADATGDVDSQTSSAHAFGAPSLSLRRRLADAWLEHMHRNDVLDGDTGRDYSGLSCPSPCGPAYGRSKSLPAIWWLPLVAVTSLRSAVEPDFVYVSRVRILLCR